MKKLFSLLALVCLSLPALAQQDPSGGLSMTDPGVITQCNQQCTTECAKKGGTGKCAQMCSCTCNEMTHNFSVEELMSIQESNYAFNAKMRAVTTKCGLSPNGDVPR